MVRSAVAHHRSEFPLSPVEPLRSPHVIPRPGNAFGGLDPPLPVPGRLERGDPLCEGSVQLDLAPVLQPSVEFLAHFVAACDVEMPSARDAPAPSHVPTRSRTLLTAVGPDGGAAATRPSARSTPIPGSRTPA